MSHHPWLDDEARLDPSPEDASWEPGADGDASHLPLAPAPWLLTRQTWCPLMRLLLGTPLATPAL